MTSRHPRTAVSVAAVLVATLGSTAAAQSLRGSHASVNLMYHSAVSGGLDFYETTSDVQRAVVRGSLVELTGNENYTVSRVRTPYVRPETRAFVIDFAVDYERACGEQMVITSAVRPMSRKLRNGSSLSVHPTGMAVDLRKPKGQCLKWLRKTLLATERNGVIEATEERHPAHFHIAVLPSGVDHVAASGTKSAPGRRARSGR